MGQWGRLRPNPLEHNDLGTLRATNWPEWPKNIQILDQFPSDWKTGAERARFSGDGNLFFIRFVANHASFKLRARAWALVEDDKGRRERLWPQINPFQRSRSLTPRTHCSQPASRPDAEETSFTT